MTRQALIVGAGIGGVSAALALQRLGWQLQISEQASVLSEVGAGIQLGPNVTRLLHQWGLQASLKTWACEPDQLVARHALHGHMLGVLPLGQAMRARFGAPYLTIHRADLHRLLLDALELQAGQGGSAIRLELGQSVQSVAPHAEGWTVQTNTQTLHTPLLLGADGLWSRVRAQIWQDGPPQPTGHVAYRALVPMADLPAALRSQEVTVWLGPALHVVQYPVRGGQAMNLVVIVHAPESDIKPQDWDQAATEQELAQELAQATRGVASGLRAVLDAVPAWRRWALFDRAPLRGPQDMARGRVALLGDAAHPMRPYLAQGAGMAIEDAYVLAQCLTQNSDQALQHYANMRWQRNARVQARAQRNGRIFHLAAPWSWARDVALRVAGPRVMNLPWLYGHRAEGAPAGFKAVVR